MPLKDLLFGFKGRIRRRDWWIWSIALGVAYYALSDATALVLGLDDYVMSRGGRLAVFGDPAVPLAHSLVLNALFLWPALALAVKRAHDGARAAWPFVICIVVTSALNYWPVDSYAAAGRGLDAGDLATGAPMIVGAVNLLAGLYQLVVLGILDGTRGPNRFGRSPKGVGGDMPDQTAKVFS